MAAPSAQPIPHVLYGAPQRTQSLSKGLKAFNELTQSKVQRRKLLGD